MYKKNGDIHVQKNNEWENYYWIRKKYNNEYYIAGVIKSLLDIKYAKKIGAKGVLVASIIHINKLSSNFLIYFQFCCFFL